MIAAHGLVDAPDKVAALRSMAQEMRAKGLEFDGDVSPEQIIKATEDATPQEILEAWKEAQQYDPEVANRQFIEIHNRNEGSSGLFGK